MQLMACNAKSHRCYNTNYDTRSSDCDQGSKTKIIISGAAVDALVCHPSFLVTGLQDTTTDGARDAQAAGEELLRATSKMRCALSHS